MNCSEITCAVGHKCPDTDCVVSAIAYALLKTKLGTPCLPAVAGKINRETAFVLKKTGFPCPSLLKSAEGRRLIVLDHASYAQAVDGAERAQITELVDHHGDGDITAPQMIRESVGATATLVYAAYCDDGIPIGSRMAQLLLYAVLSDTKGLHAPTTAQSDREAAWELARIAGIYDTEALYREMEKLNEPTADMTEEDIFRSDYREYKMDTKRVGIAVVNAPEGESEALCERMASYMKTDFAAYGVDHLYALVHDRRNDRSVLLFCGLGAAETVEIAFGEVEGDRRYFTPSVSRKRDISPVLSRTYGKYRRNS